MSNTYNSKYILKLYIDENDENLKEMYKNAVERHNSMVMNSSHPDSGFDLFTPLSEIEKINEAIISCHNRNHHNMNVNNYTITIKGNMKVKMSMYKLSKNSNDKLVEKPHGFYLFPRSSISKTCVRLANNTGIIDSGYRGCVAGMFDILCQEHHEINRLDNYHRLLQVCTPNLTPFMIELLVDESQLDVTERGSNGFGSTGTR